METQKIEPEKLQKKKEQKSLLKKERDMDVHIKQAFLNQLEI